MIILETRGVAKIYRAGSPGEVRALDQVSMAVLQGCFTVLSGPSGSGKTTLLAVLGALDRPTFGQVLFANQDLTACSDVALARARRRMGFVFQNSSLIPGLPVWENITYPLIPRGLGRAERQAMAGALLERLGLLPKMELRPSGLSGGEQQRVAIARALAGSPEVVLADEPTANLDAASADRVVGLLHEAHAEGKTVVVASHDPRIIRLASQLCELQSGRLLAMGSSTAPMSALSEWR
jgi:putative ABC transport system ATP-binding protein